MTLRCLLVDDNEGFLRSARTLLECEGISVVAVATNSAEALGRAKELRPDVLLVDINLGCESGFDLAGRVQGHLGAAKADVILISTHAEDDFTDLIAASPAIGFISKRRLSAGAIQHLLRSFSGRRERR